MALLYEPETTLVHGSDTITPLYPARYDDSPSTKVVFALFLNAETLIFWTVDKDPGTPYERERGHERGTPSIHRSSPNQGSSLVRGEAKIKAQVFHGF